MRNRANHPVFCAKAGQPPGPMVAILGPSGRYRVAIRDRIDFRISYKTSTNSNGFRLQGHRVGISPPAHPTPKFAFSSNKNSGFVVFINSHKLASRPARGPPGVPGVPGPSFWGKNCAKNHMFYRADRSVEALQHAGIAPAPRK